MRRRAEYQNHVLSPDFVHCRTDDGKAFGILKAINEFSGEFLAIKVKRGLNISGCDLYPHGLFILSWAQASIRPNNDSEIAAQTVRGWIAAAALKQPTSNQGAHMRTDTVKASEAGSRTNRLMRNRPPHREAQIVIKNRGNTITLYDRTAHLATARQHPKPSSRWGWDRLCI